MELTHPPSHLSGSQSSLASETGTGPTDPQRGTPPLPDPKGPSEYQLLLLTAPPTSSAPPPSGPSFLTQSSKIRKQERRCSVLYVY